MAMKTERLITAKQSRREDRKMYEQSRSATICAAICIWALIHAGVALAAPVTGLNTFAPDTDATAQSVNDNFSAVKSAVDDNDARITNNATSSGNNAFSITGNTTDITNNFDNLDQRISNFEVDLSGYGTPYSLPGTPKNVVVLARDRGDGSTAYYIRGSYESNSEQISIDGVPTDRRFFFNSAFVDTNDLGDLVGVFNYIEASDIQFSDVNNIEETTFDVNNSLAKTVDADTDYETFTCSGNTIRICIGYGRRNIGDTFAYLYDWSWNRLKGGPFSINGLTFNDVRMESGTGNNVQFRIRAKDIGEIYRRQSRSDGTIQERAVIYYYVDDGTGGPPLTGGSLAGTPFESGTPLHGLFF
jgi:hypothetical protein